MFNIPSLYLIAGVGVIGMIGFAGCQYQRAERYQAERAEAVNEVYRLEESINSKDDVISKLESVIQDWQTYSTEQATAAQEAAQRVAGLETDLRKRHRDIATLQEADRVSLTCQTFLQTDLDQYCPGITDGLRKYTADSLQRPTDRSANPGSNEAGR